MPENGRLVELVSDMLVELKEIKEQSLVTNKRLTKLEEHQGITNVLLRQHSRDLMKIADLLDQRVVHWGDRVNIDGERGVTGVVSKI